MYIFDLDDTLVRYGRRKIAVPRQNGHSIGIVSYNPLCETIVQQTGLNKYTDFVAFGTEERHKLVQRACCNQDFIYIDDRLDNIEDVKAYFPYVCTVHVPDPLILHKCVMSGREKK